MNFTIKFFFLNVTIIGLLFAKQVDTLSIQIDTTSTQLDTTSNELDTTTSVESVVLDSVYAINGDIIVGEIQSIKSKTLTIETKYSDDDFTIEWEKITRISTTTVFLITTTSGKHVTGKISGNLNEMLTVNWADKRELFSADQIVAAIQSNRKFIDRLNASIDFGYIFKKANSEQQFNGSARLGFATDKWRTSSGYNGTFSQQDSVDLTNRHEWDASFNYYLPLNLFPIVSINFLNSTELSLTLRTTGKVGLGYYFFNKNALFWNISGGITTLRENYSNESDSTKSSLEVYFGSEIHIFDIGDFSLRLIGNYYIGITEEDRSRGDANFETKYDLPLDFYIKGNFILDYDNQPAEDAETFDYQYSLGFGWEL
jgi:hypothetical protein